MREYLDEIDKIQAGRDAWQEGAGELSISVTFAGIMHMFQLDQNNCLDLQGCIDAAFTVCTAIVSLGLIARHL